MFAMHTPDERNPGHRFSKLQPDLPDVGLLITASDAKDLCNISFHKLFSVSCLAFLLLCTGGKQTSSCT